MWAGLHYLWDIDVLEAGPTGWEVWGAPGMWDEREQAYQGFRLALCALYDPDPVYGGNGGKCKSLIASSFTSIWKLVHDHFGDYSFPVFSGNIGSHIAPNDVTYVTATNGSNVVTLNNGTWSSATFVGDATSPLDMAVELYRYARSVRRVWQAPAQLSG